MPCVWWIVVSFFVGVGVGALVALWLWSQHRPPEQGNQADDDYSIRAWHKETRDD